MNQNGSRVNGEASDAFTDTIYQTGPGSSNLLSISNSFATETAGTAQSFTVTALSPNGGIDTNYTGTIHFTSTDPQASRLPNQFLPIVQLLGRHRVQQRDVEQH